MDASEVLQIIGAINTRTLQAERRQARSEQELVAIRESLSQSRSELEEIVRLTELLTFLLSMAQEYILVAACARKRVTGYLVTHFCMVSTAPIGVPTGEACL
ncbi:hypothetical protein PENSOL_c019G12039 [Penicillium solitum]|uniref:Uncharacterized protein n=1 Tax=Penicillium solitum TaxID=60172 RepID=A0A1V6R362_9EURO|nr:uncharacterized protein PENSOL_c019G12039 [Penicillium solitum]OQD95727.1 hypothetical protein PENSOL_c019G12039 [Penicillium solitum]